MIILHGSWLPPDRSVAGCFVLWAENDSPATAPSRRGRVRRARAAAPHPFATACEEISARLSGLELRRSEPALVVARLPTENGAPLSSRDPGRGAAGAGEITLDCWRVPALRLSADEALHTLLPLGAQSPGSDLEAGDDLHFWVDVARFSLELICRQRLFPSLQPSGGGSATAWLPQLDEGDRQRLVALSSSMPPVCRALSWTADGSVLGPRSLLHQFLAAAADGVAREALTAHPIALPKSGRTRSRVLQAAWIDALATEPVLMGDPGELGRFVEHYRAWAEPPEPASDAPDSFRICFRLSPPLTPLGPGEVESSGSSSEWTLDYLLQATDDPSLLVPVSEVWRRGGQTARFLDRRFDSPQERLLAGLGRASRLFPPIERSLLSARPEDCRLSAAEAQELLRERALLLNSAGFGVLVPGVETRLGLRVKLGARKRDGRSAAATSFGWDSLVQYDWQLAIGDQTVSREEFEALARLKQPLVQVRGQWVELRAGQIEQALTLFAGRGAGEELTLPDALRIALAPDGERGLPVVAVESEGWIDELLRNLSDGAAQHIEQEPEGFDGRLRRYQMTGLSWLASLSRFGVGACLADDMGLGKTVQLIALLLYQRAEGLGSGPTLLICPTSVVGNWRHELARFAPGLRVLVHHGAGRAREELAAAALQHDVVVSTYALLHRDEAELTSVDWTNVALDEAQNVKNSSTQAAQAARRLHARWRVALTGTPIENRLSDLWSLFQFLAPGYLGSNEEFRRRFVLPIERAGDAAATARLKALVAPLILRRLKTDRSIIEDLPEKNEMKVFCTLTREQATLYEAIVRDSVEQIEAAEGMQRRGLILATIATLKQNCDHPALLLKDRSTLPGRSGKLARLEEMLEEVVALGDRALVFTQYAEMGAMLKPYLEARFGREVLFLHGGTPSAHRDRMVERFQAGGRTPSIFILSIKAGGTGLNLTRANHVFHFDRWWNPAVEDQATDRAFRIGQRRDVQVHKFICAGTFEEAIDGLIERKIALSQSILGASEGWITELSTDQLRELFALRREAAGVE